MQHCTASVANIVAQEDATSVDLSSKRVLSLESDNSKSFANLPGLNDDQVPANFDTAGASFVQLVMKLQILPAPLE